MTVMVRPESQATADFPEAVTVVEGEVGEYADLRKAMQGIRKVPQVLETLIIQQ